MEGFKWVIRSAVVLVLFVLLGSRASGLRREDMEGLAWRIVRAVSGADRNALNAVFWAVACAAAIAYFLPRRRKVFMLDFACYKPGDDRKCNFELAEYFVKRSQRFSYESMEFQRKIYNNSGLGEETYVPPFIFKENHEELSLEAAWEETSEVMFGAVDEVLRKTDVKAQEIGVLIVACSMFSPAPSLCSSIIRRYKMEEDVKAINLTGMGCSSGVLATDLAGRLLGSQPRGKNTCALVVITENITLNWYFGNNRSMLVTNCLFRVGCAALVLSNDPGRRRSAKMEILHSVRTHTGADDRAYGAALQEEDEDGMLGIGLKKDLVRVAVQGLSGHMRALGPLVLPLTEQLRYLASVAARRILKMDVKTRIPDFKLAFDHFCIHTGGKAVIEEIGRAVGLDEYLLEPPLMVLHRFGNTSNSMVFYELAYMEAMRRIKKGDKVWMLSFGTGFKCSSVVWKALQDLHDPISNPWLDCVHRYPVKFEIK